jgi:hypothetical protein
MSPPSETRDDLLIFDFIYGVIICKICQYAIVPREIASHLRTHHQKEEGLTTQQIKTISSYCLTYPSRPPAWIKDMPLPPDTAAVPFLRLHRDGFCCRLCQLINPYVCLTEGALTDHLKKAHQWSRPRGAQSAAKQKHSGLQTVAIFPIACQTFFRRNLFIRYFVVQPPSTGTLQSHVQHREPDNRVQALSIPEQIELQLDQKLAELDPATSGRPGQQHFSQVSSWLDTTQWTHYLKGHDLLVAARLINIPSSATVEKAAPNGQDCHAEYYLLLLLDSFDHVIEKARSSLLEDRINVFDQH